MDRGGLYASSESAERVRLEARGSGCHPSLNSSLLGSGKQPHNGLQLCLSGAQMPEKGAQGHRSEKRAQGRKSVLQEEAAFKLRARRKVGRAFRAQRGRAALPHKHGLVSAPAHTLRHRPHRPGRQGQLGTQQWGSEVQLRVVFLTHALCKQASHDARLLPQRTGQEQF